MNPKQSLNKLFLVVLCAAAILGPTGPSWSDDAFYVVAGSRRHIITTPDNTALGVNAYNATSSGTLNTAIGVGALHASTTGYGNTACGNEALHATSTGAFNTASGSGALRYNTTGFYNTASGGNALRENTNGSYNTASGLAALYKNITGSWNTASGADSLYHNTTGSYNTAVGYGALVNSHGSGNTAVGRFAGYNGNFYDNFTGSDNIYIGKDVSPDSLTESGTIRIGSSVQSRTFIMGIDGAAAGGSPVYVNAWGQLSIGASSRRYKEDIRDMGEASRALMQLRPVTFHYKPEYAGGPRTLQYGLIAEEVAAVNPDLVFYDPQTGQPQTVAYHLVNAMLLNEVQKQHRRILTQEKMIQTQEEKFAAQEKKINALEEQNKGLAENLSALQQQNKDLAALKEHVRVLIATVAQHQESVNLLAGLEE